MPDGDLGFLAQGVEDVKTLGVRNIFQVDAAKTGLQQHDGIDDGVRVFGVEHDGDTIYAAQVFVQQGLAFHDGQACFGADISQAQHAGTIADHSNGIPLVGVLVYLLGIFGNGATGSCNPRCVPDGKVIEIAHAALERGFNLAPVEGVQNHCVGRGLLGFGQKLVYIDGLFNRHSVFLYCCRYPSA